MKTIIFSIALLCFFFASGQITYEHSYVTHRYTNGSESQVYYFNTATETYYYIYTGFQSSPYNIEIYNSAHNLVKTVALPDDSQILYITDKLFNDDNNFELLILVPRMVTLPNPYYTRDTVLINDLGETLYTFQDRFYAHIFKDYNGNFKLAVDGIYNSTGESTYQFDIYSLSGTLAVSQENAYLDKSIAYPIPVIDELTIQNKNRFEVNTDVEIFDIQGKKILEQKVVDQGDIILNLSSLASGTYMCKIKNEVIKFIKR